MTTFALVYLAVGAALAMAGYVRDDHEDVRPVTVFLAMVWFALAWPLVLGRVRRG